MTNTKESRRKYKIKYPWRASYDRAKERCKRSKSYVKKGIRCYFTPEEVKTLWVRDKAHLLERPSIDRIENDGHYTYKNCRFIENDVNKNKDNKVVLQLTQKGEPLKTFNSLGEAARSVGGSINGIESVLWGKRKTYKAYKWVLIVRYCRLCGKKHYALGFCKNHWQKKWRKRKGITLNTKM